MVPTAAANVRLRAAAASDLPAIEQLLEAAQLPTAGVPDLIPAFVVAEGNEGLLGAAAVERCAGDLGLLRSVVVLPTQRGSGVGQELVTRSIAEARRHGIKALYLLTTTAETYFPRFGFVKVTRDSLPEGVRATQEFREACPASAAVMTLRLD